MATDNDNAAGQPGASSTPAKAISERKLAANRTNALKSTGPRTERGKAVSRLNATKHGILAHYRVGPRGEKFIEPDLVDLREALLDLYGRDDARIFMLVEGLVLEYWHQQRAAYADLIMCTAGTTEYRCTEFQVNEPVMTSVRRYLTASQNATLRHLKVLDQYLAEREESTLALEEEDQELASISSDALDAAPVNPDPHAAMDADIPDASHPAATVHCDDAPASEDADTVATAGPQVVPGACPEASATSGPLPSPSSPGECQSCESPTETIPGSPVESAAASVLVTVQ